MSKIYLKKISHQFKFKNNPENEMSVELLKKSKQLVLNNSNYNNYSNFYHSFTTKFTYKLPDINIYPLQKNTNIISLREIKLYNDTKKDTIKNKILYFPISNDCYSTIFTQETNDNNNTNNTNNNNNNKNNISENKIYNNQETINEKNFLNYIDKFNNMNNVMYKYITYRETYYINQLNEINYLISVIQNQKKENKIDLFDENEINCKLNVFNIYNNNIEVKLIFNSIIIYIFDINDKKIEKLKLPFIFIPFFYGTSLQLFKLMLLNIIEYNKEENKLFINKNKFNNNFKEFLDTKQFYNNLSFINNYKTINEIKLNWFVRLDLNKYSQYKLLIKLPHFKTRIKNSNEKKLTFFKTIDIKYTSYLMKDKFKDWDLFLLNTFCIYKDFRFYINNALSYNNENKVNNYINFNDNKTKIYFQNNMKNAIEFYVVEKRKNDIFKNLYFKISSPYIEIAYIKNNIFENLSSKKKIQLTFKEAIQINKLRHSWYPEELIKKCCNLKNYKLIYKTANKDSKKKIIDDEIDINLQKYIYGFDESVLKYVKRNKFPIPDKKVTKNNFNVKIIEPKLQWCDKITDKLYKYSLETKDYEKLFDLPLNQWEIFILNIIPKIMEFSELENPEEDIDKSKKKRLTYKATFKSHFKI